MIRGIKTSAMPASAVGSQGAPPTRYLDISPVEACANMIKIFGQAMRKQHRHDRRSRRSRRVCGLINSTGGFACFEPAWLGHRQHCRRLAPVSTSPSQGLRSPPLRGQEFGLVAVLSQMS